MSSIVKRGIDAATAMQAIAAAEAKAVAINVPMCIAIADEAGHLKAALRMDGTSLGAMQVAQDKAYSAAILGLATHLWYDILKDDPPLLHGLPHLPRLVIFGGGYPIREAGEMIGAIGLSGGHYTQDMECARSALEAIGAAAHDDK